MQSGAIWKFKNIKVTFPKTPYIDEVCNLWNGKKIYHVENYFINGEKYEWTSKPDLFPHISKYGYGVLEEVSLSMQQIGVYRSFFGNDPDVDYIAKCWNSSD
jgi:hypothetical protein